MLFLLLLLTTWQRTDAPAPCQVRLELQQQNGLLIVTGHCRNLQPTAARYHYEMALRRESTGGHSQNTQRGEISVAPQQEVSLSQTRVNVSIQDTYRIYLRVFDMEGHAVAQDSVVQNPAR